MTKKILLADDDPEILDLLKFTFETENFNVITAMDGEEAFRKSIEEQPDIIILDVMMPKKTGFEVCEQLRQNSATALTPIIMLTSLSQVKDRLTGIKLGADEYLPKPTEPFELVARVERLIERTRTALASSPLTGLPSNVNAENEIKKRLDSGADFAVIYLDINRFGYFNDLYGFDKGDNILRLLSIIIRTAVKELTVITDFISHLGNDDFMIILSANNPNIHLLCETIIQNFSTFIKSHYSQTDIANGFLSHTNPDGSIEKIPFLSIAIGITKISSDIKHYAQVINKVKKLWSQAKQKVEDCCVSEL